MEFANDLFHLAETGVEVRHVAVKRADEEREIVQLERMFHRGHGKAARGAVKQLRS